MSDTKIYCDGMDELALKSQFEIGKSYIVKPRDDTYPVLDGENKDRGNEETIVSHKREFMVIGFPDDRPGFVEVKRPGRENTDLYFMARTESLESVPSPEQVDEPCFDDDVPF